MGDSPSIQVKSYYDEYEKDGVYLYSHWGGKKLSLTLKKALERRERWNDSPYLTRMIFCEMLQTGDNSLNGETGFGISNALGENSYPVIVVDPDNQKVWIGETSWSFKEYINTSDEDILKVFKE